MPTSRREIRRLANRERLYQSALDEFRRVGVERAQVSEIAAAAEVAYGTFYAHFENKQAVLLECSLRMARRIRERLDATDLAGLSSAVELFRSIAEAHVEVRHEAPELADDVWKVALAQGEDFPRHPHTAAVAHQVASLQGRELIRRDRPADEIAGIFLTGLAGFLVRAARGLDSGYARYCEMMGEACAPT